MGTVLVQKLQQINEAKRVEEQIYMDDNRKLIDVLYDIINIFVSFWVHQYHFRRLYNVI